MTRALEAVVWCPRCKEDKYKIYRVPTGQEGVFMNQTEPRGADTVKAYCWCGTTLERKP